MKKRYNILIPIQLLVVLAILIVPTSTHGLGESFEEGVFYTYHYISRDELTATNSKENTEYHETWNSDGEIALNITSINNITEYLFYDQYTTNGVTAVGNSYDIEDISSTVYALGSIFYPDYSWDFEHNKTVLVDFSCFATYRYFVEPNWTYLNDHFATIFNESDIVDTVNDPYTAVIHNITLGDVLNDTISFSIMGANSFPAITNEFIGNITRWTFEYDFSGKIYYGVYNSTLGANNYYPYEIYKESLIIEYSSGGIMQYYYHNKEIKWTQDDETFKTYDEDTIAYGPSPETTTEDSSLYFLTSIPAIAMVVIIYKIKKRN